jgi:hypothetical protein
MQDIKRDIKSIDNEEIIKENLGLIFSKLESIEEFFPCYKTMMKK